MSSLGSTKIFAAVLTAGIIAMMSGFIAEVLMRPSEISENAYPIGVEAGAPSETQAAEASAAEAPTLEEIGPLLAAADVAAGQKASRKCKSCHTFDQGGANKIGPNLWNIIGRDMASTGGFGYSSGMQKMSGKAWDFESMNAFLYKPKEMVPGTKMTFAGLKKVKDRANLIAYLRSLSDSPAPLPE